MFFSTIKFNQIDFKRTIIKALNNYNPISNILQLSNELVCALTMLLVA